MTRRYIEPLSDNTSLYIGALCLRGHSYNNTNQSLRYRRGRDCVECQKLRNHRAGNERKGPNAVTNERRRQLQKYGVTPEQYDVLFTSQGGVCAICQQANKGGRNLSVDHCHKSGNIRGLLCSACNRGIGLLNDSPAQLRKAIQYLEK